MNQTLTSNDLRDIADNFRAIARDIQDVTIPKLQAELQSLRNNGASPDLIAAKRSEISEASSSSNTCITTAVDLDNKAILETLTSTDINNAKAAIVCSTTKIKLAVNRLNEIRSILSFVAALINLGAAIVAAASTSGISFASIQTLIEAIDALSESEISGNLSDEEKEKLQGILEKCLPSA